MGCKLTSPFAVEVGEEVSVVLPKDLTGTKTTSVKGRVISGHDAGFSDSSEHAMSVIFCDLTLQVRRLLARIMSTRGLVHTTKIDEEREQEGDGVTRQRARSRAPDDHQPRRAFGLAGLLRLGLPRMGSFKRKALVSLAFVRLEGQSLISSQDSGDSISGASVVVNGA